MTTKDWNIDFVELAEKYPATANPAVFEFIRNLLAQRNQELIERVSMLRQWLNEDRITEPKKMVTNEDILNWLEIKENI